MKKFLVLFLGLFLLSACGATTKEFKPKTTVKVITGMTYPEFPDIEPLPPLGLIPWQHNVPRDLLVLSVKNITNCRSIGTHVDEELPYIVLPNEEQTETWWKKCGENPILPLSNIYVGFDQENWNLILENFNKLRERNWQYKQRIIEINNQRMKWRSKAEAERKRLDLLQRPIEKNPKISTKKPKSIFNRLFNMTVSPPQ